MTEKTQALLGFSLDVSRVVRLAPDTRLSPIEVDEAYWAHRHVRPELREGSIISVFEYEATWDWWERHSTGDELAYVIEGTAAFWLRTDESDDDLRRIEVETGNCAIIPRGLWHRAEVAEPSRILFVTPTPALTEVRAD